MACDRIRAGDVLEQLAATKSMPPRVEVACLRPDAPRHASELHAYSLKWPDPRRRATELDNCSSHASDPRCHALEQHARSLFEAGSAALPAATAHWKLSCCRIQSVAHQRSRPAAVTDKKRDGERGVTPWGWCAGVVRVGRRRTPWRHQLRRAARNGWRGQPMER